MPANGGLLRIGYPSPGSETGRCGSEIVDSLRQIFEIFPFSGDPGRRPGSICTAWPSLQCIGQILRLDRRQIGNVGAARAWHSFWETEVLVQRWSGGALLSMRTKGGGQPPCAGSPSLVVWSKP